MKACYNLQKMVPFISPNRAVFPPTVQRSGNQINRLFAIRKEKNVRYRYPTEKGGCTLTFVGFQEPLEIIPAGTLVRVSLAHWWQPEDTPDVEERCYAQLSGWFFKEEPKRSIEVKSPPPQTAASNTPRGSERRFWVMHQFRPLQEEIINHILNRHDALIVLPTGGGQVALLSTACPYLRWRNCCRISADFADAGPSDAAAGAGVFSAAFLNSTLNNSEYVATMHTRQTR